MSERFDAARLVVVAGDGIVARFPGIACVARPAGHAALPVLVEHCAKAAGDDPGRGLARRLAGWLSGPDAPGDDLEFATAAVAGDRLALFVSGAVTARVADGPTVSGASSAAWSDRLVPFGEVGVTLAPDAVAVPDDARSGPVDLVAGVVPGAAAVLLPGAASGTVPDGAREPARRPVARPSTPDDPASPPSEVPSEVPAAVPSEVSPEVPAPVLEAPPLPPVQQVEPVVEPPAPRRSESLRVGPGGGESRDPLEPGAPVGSRPPIPPDGSSEDRASTEQVPAEPSAPAEPRQPRTRGHLCSHGHLNDPRSHFCVLCGIRMNQNTGVLTLGPRPPLGLLVFDNGATYTVDAEYLLGRTPDADERVRGGSLRPLVVEDGEGAVSRVHAEVRVRGWDVVLVDSGSRNGTFVVPPGGQSWTVVASGRSHRLSPGTRVRLGEKRTFVFESPSGVR